MRHSIKKAMMVYFMCGESDQDYTVGFAIAADMIELFWQIDFHYDPYCVKIIPIAESTSIAFNIKNTTRDEDGDIIDYETGEVEPYESFPDFDDERWEIPVWPENVYDKR